MHKQQQNQDQAGSMKTSVKLKTFSQTDLKKKKKSKNILNTNVRNERE